MSSKITWNMGSSSKMADKQVASVLAMSGRLHNNMHVAACNALIQAMVHGNTNAITTLVNGLSGTSIHVKGLIEWAKARAPITFRLVKPKDDSKATIKVTMVEGWSKVSIEDATAKAQKWAYFWKVSPPPAPFKGFNYKEELAKLNKRASEMARAKREGTIKRGDEVIELDADQIKAINLDGFETVTH